VLALERSGCEQLDYLSAPKTEVICSSETSINFQSQSQNHFTTDGQSVCLSWCRAPYGPHDQILLVVTVRQLQSCPLGGALSDERVGLSCV
jgi:hypothetical protein